LSPEPALSPTAGARSAIAMLYFTSARQHIGEHARANVLAVMMIFTVRASPEAVPVRFGACRRIPDTTTKRSHAQRDLGFGPRLWLGGNSLQKSRELSRGVPMASRLFQAEQINNPY
jgi:hypothetical protein